MHPRWDPTPKGSDSAFTLRVALGPTDQPVMADCWSANRNLDSGCWFLCEVGPDGDHDIRQLAVAVVDDFGDLALLDDEAMVANYRFGESASPDASAELRRSCGHEPAPPVKTAGPLTARSRPVQVQVLGMDDDALVCASVLVGEDPGFGATLYSVHVDGETPMLVTHHQLAALVLGAQQLLAAAHVQPQRLH